MKPVTLAVDATAKPIGVIPMQAAVAKLARIQASAQRDYRECQVLLEDPNRVFHSAGGLETPPISIKAPLVMMWPSYVQVDKPELKRVSKRVVFARDGFACMYCGKTSTPGSANEQLTIDHVKPAHLFESRAAATTYENVVSACQACNNRKGGHLPYEVNMYPKKTPIEPHFVQLRFTGRLNSAQRDYVAEYFHLTEDQLSL